MNDMIEANTADLIGPALDWAVAQIDGVEGTPGLASTGLSFEPSTNWAQGGLLIERYGVLLSPPSSLVHRNFGNFDKRNGYYESGLWGATIFGKERKYRRKSFDHPDRPLVAAMRTIVQFELGDTVRVPAELVGDAK